MTVYVLDVTQVPLISLSGLDLAANRVGGTLCLSTCSATNTVALSLSFAQKPAVVLRTRRERGYPVLKGELASDGRFILSENGVHLLILDTGAQACVVGPEYAHFLVRRQPPPSQ